MRFARFVLAASALPFAGIGIAFLVAPESMANRVGLMVTSATAQSDVRAVYGGLQLGCAAFLALCAAKPAWVRPGLAVVVLTFGGLAGARVVSWVDAGLPDALGIALHSGELTGLICGGVAWRLLRAGTE